MERRIGERLQLHPDAWLGATDGSARLRSLVLQEAIATTEDTLLLARMFEIARPPEAVAAELLRSRRLSPTAERLETLREALDDLREHGVLCPVRTCAPDAASRLLWAPTCAADQEELELRGWSSSAPVGSVLDLAARDVRTTADHVAVAERGDGEELIVRGASEVAARLRAGRPVEVWTLPGASFLWDAVRTGGEFFGTGRTGAPYQAIVDATGFRIRGTRADLGERQTHVDRDDLVGRRILDLGCNVGMSSFLACAGGAVSAEGVDSSAALVDAAVRLNAWFDAPCRFRVGDLSHGILDVPRVDTVFVFALLGHLPSAAGVIETIAAACPRAVYVETHAANQSQGDLDGLLSWSGFESVIFLGHGSDNNHAGTRSRRRYRCKTSFR